MKLTGVVPISGRDRGGKRNQGVHTDRIRTDVVIGETVELRKIAGVIGAKVEGVLPTLPY